MFAGEKWLIRWADIMFILINTNISVVHTYAYRPLTSKCYKHSHNTKFIQTPKVI